MPEVVLTPEGKERIEQELERLRGRGRDEIADRLRHSVEMSRELAETAEYLAAKEEQERLERRIVELEARLEQASVVRGRGGGDGVGVGTHVRLRDRDARRTEEYDIVGSGEGDPSAGRISMESPLGQALLGHREGEEVEVDVPAGRRHLKILAIGSRGA